MVIDLSTIVQCNRSHLHYIFRRCSRPRQIVWCYTNYRYKPYLSHWKVRLLTALLNCQNCQFWQFDRDKRTVGLVFIIYRVLLVYVCIGLAWWMCRHTFELVRGRRRLKRAGGSQAQLPVRKYCSTKVSRSMVGWHYSNKFTKTEIAIFVKTVYCAVGYSSTN